MRNSENLREMIVDKTFGSWIEIDFPANLAVMTRKGNFE